MNNDPTPIDRIADKLSAVLDENLEIERIYIFNDAERLWTSIELSTDPGFKWRGLNKYKVAVVWEGADCKDRRGTIVFKAFVQPTCIEDMKILESPFDHEKLQEAYWTKRIY